VSAPGAASPERARVVALTGGIASGKGAVGDAFERLGVPLFDADRVARDLVRHGQPALGEIAESFGAGMLLADGNLDRARMRALVFSDPLARRQLEAILHPRVHASLLASATACRDPYCLLVIPLLVEVREKYAFVDRTLVVDVSRSVQVARLIARDHCTAEAAESMIAAQAPRGARLAIADDVIDNDGPRERLAPIVDRLHARYRRSAVAAD
jgi:dephospho-CoA kinase